MLALRSAAGGDPGDDPSDIFGVLGAEDGGGRALVSVGATSHLSLDSARLLFSAPGEAYWIALSHEGAICLVALVDVGGDTLIGSSCRNADAYRKGAGTYLTLGLAGVDEFHAVLAPEFDSTAAAALVGVNGEMVHENLATFRGVKGPVEVLGRSFFHPDED
jgi:hypothetical protein